MLKCFVSSFFFITFFLPFETDFLLMGRRSRIALGGVTCRPRAIAPVRQACPVIGDGTYPTWSSQRRTNPRSVKQASRRKIPISEGKKVMGQLFLVDLRGIFLSTGSADDVSKKKGRNPLYPWVAVSH